MLLARFADVEDLFMFVSFRFKAKENGREMFKQTSVKQTTAQTQARQPNKQMMESAGRRSLPKQSRKHFKDPGKQRHIVADTLLPTQMFRRLPGVAHTNFVSGTQKVFLTLFRNILCPQQMFPSLRSPRNIMSNNVSATMCHRFPGP